MSRKALPALPPPRQNGYEPYRLGNLAGPVLVLSDVHLPDHDRATVEAAVGEARRRKAAAVLLNGDLLDAHRLSEHDQEERAAAFFAEVDTAQRFLRWLRSRLPKARIVVKEGNHDFRVRRYLATRARELVGLPSLEVPNLIGLPDVGGEWVQDKRPVKVGKLWVYHGHEFRGSGGVNPAKWLLDRSRVSSLCGHFHRSSEYATRDAAGKVFAAWSVGCACWTHPQYDPLNQWVQGYAVVDVAADGTFHVENRRLYRGRVL